VIEGGLVQPAYGGFFFSSNVFASNQAATSASTSGLFGQPNVATSWR
jgi:hypothetical protein